MSTTTIPILQEILQDIIKGQKEAKPAGFELFEYVSCLSCGCVAVEERFLTLRARRHMISIQAALNEQLIRVIPINHSGTTPVVVMIDGIQLSSKIYILVQKLVTGDLLGQMGPQRGKYNLTWTCLDHQTHPNQLLHSLVEWCFKRRLFVGWWGRCPRPCPLTAHLPVECGTRNHHHHLTLSHIHRLPRK